MAGEVADNGRYFRDVQQVMKDFWVIVLEINKYKTMKYKRKDGANNASVVDGMVAGIVNRIQIRPSYTPVILTSKIEVIRHKIECY